MLIAYKALADLAGKGSLFLITIVATRRLSPEAFGVFAIGSTSGWLLAVATDFGIQLHLARAVARRPADAAPLLHAWLRVRLWTTTAALALVGAGLLATGWRASYTVPIAVFLLQYACSGLVEFLHYFYRGLSRSDVESSLTLWQRVATLGCGLLALAWHPGVTTLAVALLLPVVVTLGASLRIARSLAARGSSPIHGLRETEGPQRRGSTEKTLGNLRVSVPPWRSSPRLAGRADFPHGLLVPQDDARSVPGPAIATEFWRDVLPIGAGIVLSALYFRIDVFLVQLWSGTESVALYNAVFRLVEALRLFPAAVLAVTLPSLCRARDLGPLARVSWPVTAFAVVVAAVLWVAAGTIIPLVYGARYAAAVPAFRVLLLSFPLLSLNYALTHQLVGWDGQRAYAVLCGLALVVNVALNARLIPAWSIEGAAWATLGTEAFLTAGCLGALYLGTRGTVLEHSVTG